MDTTLIDMAIDDVRAAVALPAGTPGKATRIAHAVAEYDRIVLKVAGPERFNEVRDAYPWSRRG